MLVELFTNTSENYRIDKSIQSQGTYDCILKNGCSIENPIIQITAPSLVGINYMRIQAFGRYYYINDIVSLRNNMWEISAHVDVLMSYANEIKACQATFKRQENLFNMVLSPKDTWNILKINIEYNNEVLLYMQKFLDEMNVNHSVLFENMEGICHNINAKVRIPGDAITVPRNVL